MDEPNVTYEGGEVTVIQNADIDKWSYSRALSLGKELVYDETVKLCFKL